MPVRCKEQPLIWAVWRQATLSWIEATVERFTKDEGDPKRNKLIL